MPCPVFSSSSKRVCGLANAMMRHTTARQRNTKRDMPEQVLPGRNLFENCGGRDYNCCLLPVGFLQVPPYHGRQYCQQGKEPGMGKSDILKPVIKQGQVRLLSMVIAERMLLKFCSFSASPGVYLANFTKSAICSACAI